MEQIIYIEQKDREEASRLAKSFTIEETKLKAYINSLGAELIMKYLAQEDIDVSNVQNIHNISKFREEFELADVILPNIRIDARMVYDKNIIFIPKSHFEYNLLPDIYVVFEVADDSTNVKFLGFFEPKMINENNHNDKYYFIEKEKLSSPKDLKAFIENFNGNNTQDLSDEETELGQKLALSLIDHNIQDSDKKKLIEMLKKSASLREDLIEFDNFEIISYHVIKSESYTDPDITVETKFNEEIDEFDVFEKPFDNIQQNTNLTEDITTSTETLSEALPTNETPDSVEDLALSEPLDNNLVEPLEEITELEPLDTTSGETLAELTPSEDLTLSEPLDNSLVEPLEEMTELEPLDTTSGETLAELTPSEDLTENLTDSVEDLTLSEPLDNSLVEPLEEMTELEPLDTTSGETLAELTPSEDLTLSEPLDNSLVEPLENVSLESTETPISESTDLNNEINQEVITPIDTEITQEPEMIVNNDDIPVVDSNENVENLETLSLDDFTDILESENNENEPVNTPTEEPAEINNETNNIIYENSQIISNENITPGEIQIDINTPQIDTKEAIDKLEVLYNDNNNDTTIEQKTTTKKEIGKKGILLGTAIIAALVSIMLFTTMNKPANKKSLKKKSNKPIERTVENIVPEEDLGQAPVQELEEQSIPETPQTKSKKKNIQKEAAEEEVKAVPKGPAIEVPFLEVKKLSWAVPNYISYNENFRKFLQTAGKSLKLSLSSDLLLANEYAYSNKLQVDIMLSKEGSVEESKMLQSSGSQEIDKIVLRTVKETLNVLKAPTDAMIGENMHITLIIYL